ncbi:Aerotaxis receptor [Aliarcobacter thereius]|uniref:Aerotaxis receptor n=2 Tax=Aliarcobacter thereius TaxID=544718 RepID=A0A1C0B6L4_9BACT|nr:PAS domain-containing protein [Aliarcobacter thereius]OCL86771.1 Aerotaxis receptor [Aliarcobacter thereius]OCL90973.1 Aerotaxis receptor [Aliarcobacter thereius]OCL96198.1 Aerotaxis receptor [Aliarcobacter thereius LMG 24486]OCL98940.1 Aerotaxis receptor [Aliarcobacter thereius]QBF15837.1 PAS sensor-containing signal transduction protein [Aliarcobacter thereius LMG 24486]
MRKETILEENTFLVSETDEKGIIKFANSDFCTIAEYSLNELIGKPHNIVRDKDMPKVAFKSLWDTVQKDEIWTGYVKNATKSGGFYWVFATVYPFISCDGSKGYLSCRRKASKEEIKQYEKIYAKLLSEE